MKQGSLIPMVAASMVVIAGCFDPDSLSTSPYRPEVPSNAYIAAHAASFTGSATGTPLAANVVGDHPGLAGRGHNGMNADSYM